MPGYAAGTTRTVTVRGAVTDARRERRALLAAGRPALSREPDTEQAKTLTEHAAEVLRTRSAVLGGRTIRNYTTDFRFRIAPRLGHLPLDQIARKTVELFVADLAGEATSYRMLSGTVTTLKMLLNVAVEWGEIPSNPAARVRLPPRPPDEEDDARKAISHDQLKLLLSAGTTKLRVRTMLRFAGEGGVRRGEICGLHWPDVDLAKRRIRVRYSYEDPTKGRRERTIEISSHFANELDAWYSESVIDGGADAKGFVWPGVGGGMMDEHSPTQTCSRALKRAGLVDDEGRPLITLHILRHTCASIMFAKNVPLIVVSRHLGHANTTITSQVYEHLIDDSQMRAAADAFEQLST